jgi:protease I
MSGKSILMLVGEFTEEYEIFVFQQAMEAVGHSVHVVCPNKKAGERIKTSLHDFEGDETYTEKLGHFFTLNKSFKDVREADYDAVYVAGGRGPEYIRINPRVIEILRSFHAEGKPIFSICHGIQVLGAAEIIDGRRVAALEYCEPEVRLARGIYVDVPPEGATRDGNLVTAKGWPGLAAFMRECLLVLGTEVRHGKVMMAERSGRTSPAKRSAVRRAAEQPRGFARPSACERPRRPDLFRGIVPRAGNAGAASGRAPAPPGGGRMRGSGSGRSRGWALRRSTGQ